jgi:hypothetical protein
VEIKSPTSTSSHPVTQVLTCKRVSVSVGGYAVRRGLASEITTGSADELIDSLVPMAKCYGLTLVENAAALSPAVLPFLDFAACAATVATQLFITRLLHRFEELDAVRVNGSSRITQHGGSPRAKMPNGCLEIPWSSHYRLDKKGFLMGVQIHA